MSSVYLRLLILLPAILSPACASSSPALHMMYSAYKLNKQGWQYTALTYSFPNLEPICCSMSGSNCCLLPCLQISQEAGKVVWYSLLFKNFPQFVVKVLHSICQQFWKTQQWPQDWKRSVFITIPKKGNAKECSNYCTIALISHTRKVMLKILQARGTKYQITGFRWSLDHPKSKSSRKISISALLTMPKPLTV